MPRGLLAFLAAIPLSLSCSGNASRTPVGPAATPPAAATTAAAPDTPPVATTPAAPNRVAAATPIVTASVTAEDEVRRASLKGETESVLFANSQITWIEVSPDGTKVAIVYGRDRSGDTSPVAVRFVDIATGEKILDTGRRFDPIFTGSSQDLRQRWHAGGTALLVEEERRPGFLRLDGTFDPLPEDWHLSPDLRHALRTGEEVGVLSLNRHQIRTVWASLDVLDVETGEVLWTVRAHEGGGLYRHLHFAGDGWWGPGLSKELAWEDRRHLFFKELAPEPDWRAGHQPGLGVLTVLDIDTGKRPAPHRRSRGSAAGPSLEQLRLAVHADVPRTVPDRLRRPCHPGGRRGVAPVPGSRRSGR